MSGSSYLRSRHYVALWRRAMLNTIRQPATIVPPLVFPLLFLAMSSSALERSTEAPGFPPVDSFLQFMLAATIVQGTLFGAVGAGTDMARDIEGGFFDRLISSPVSRNSILIGRVGGAAALGFFQAWFFLFVAVTFGAQIEGGIPAMLLLSIVATLLSGGIGAITSSIGLRTGSSETVQGSFPLIFVFLFISSAFFPRELMDGWFKTVASINPISHLVEGMRIQITEGVAIDRWLVAMGISFGLFVFGVVTARRALTRRLARAA